MHAVAIAILIYSVLPIFALPSNAEERMPDLPSLEQFIEKLAPIKITAPPNLPKPAAKREEDLLIDAIIDKISIYAMPEEPRVKVKERSAVILKEMLASMRKDILREMVDRRMRLVIIPSQVSFNDLIGGMHGDFGRLRGFAFVSQSDGSMAAYLGEEEILQQTSRCQDCRMSEHPPGHLLVHEWAHMVSLALPREMQLALFDLFHTAITSRGRLPSEYSYYNIVEYFAEASALWFGVQNIDPTGAVRAV